MQKQKNASSKTFKGGKSNGDSRINEHYHKTKLLLSIYRTVVWRIESAIYLLDETAGEYGGKRISVLIDFLSLELDDYGYQDRKTVEDRLMCISETKQLIDIIDKALLHLKTLPKNGEIYHDVIINTYINKEVLSNEAIISKLCISSSSYYRYKKEAIEKMGVALWGYIIPPLKDYWDN